MKKTFIFFVLLFIAFFGYAEDSFDKAQVLKEAILKRAEISVSVPQISNFLERINVARRAKVMDQPNKLFYVYLFNYGVERPIAYIILQGKVSSLRSYLVPQERTRYVSEDTYAVVQDADIDGTYGENSSGIFGFTVSGAYFEWNMGFSVFDAPMPIFNVPELSRVTK